jgi:hypothetical protein
MRGAIPSLSQYVFMARCLVKHRDKCTFTFAFLPFATENKTHKRMHDWVGLQKNFNILACLTVRRKFYSCI